MPDRLDDLRAALRRSGVTTAAGLRVALGVSQPTLSRLLAGLQSSLVRFGRTRRARYALARSVRGLPTALPLYRIRPDGRGERAGVLRALEPEGFALAGRPDDFWPLPGEMAEGRFEGLPYFLFDARPQGFLGRALAKRRAPELNVPDDPSRWSDDDIVLVLVLAGEDLPGDLVLGEPAYERLLRRMSQPKVGLADADLAQAYPRLAREALEEGVATSSAGGEFPKFTATRSLPDGPREVIVKFAAEGRWSDLLVAESVAAATLSAHLDRAAPCRIHRFDGRTYLEVERFDRAGAWGRAPACTLAAVDPALLGLGDARWDRAARALADDGFVGDAARDRILERWCFGNLIANSDMHAGNLAFHPVAGRLALTPSYDMLPMRYAPGRGDELPAPAFDPMLPLPGLEHAWRAAASAAVGFWEDCGRHELISAGFRETSRRNAERVAALRERVGR